MFKHAPDIGEQAINLYRTNVWFFSRRPNDLAGAQRISQHADLSWPIALAF